MAPSIDPLSSCTEEVSKRLAPVKNTLSHSGAQSGSDVPPRLFHMNVFQPSLLIFQSLLPVRTDAKLTIKQ